MKHDTIVMLALYPNARGLGYACLESPKNLKDSGVVTVRPICNGTILERIIKFVDFFKPKIIVVKDYDNSYYWKSRRGIDLVESIVKYAEGRKLPVIGSSRKQIRDVFELFGAKSKYDIAHKIVSGFPHLEPRAPRIRESWMAEEYYMGAFDAISLALTHQYLTE